MVEPRRGTAGRLAREPAGPNAACSRRAGKLGADTETWGDPEELKWVFLELRVPQNEISLLQDKSALRGAIDSRRRNPFRAESLPVPANGGWASGWGTR
jgi:hypothetical protein